MPIVSFIAQSYPLQRWHEVLAAFLGSWVPTKQQTKD